MPPDKPKPNPNPNPRKVTEVDADELLADMTSLRSELNEMQRGNASERENLGRLSTAVQVMRQQVEAIKKLRGN